uniref:hypothetical protein n=1 Tax=Herbidospora sakaeratensis TaxID=564415 RepID=UPI000AD4741A|nr:hypothetical protein [Herbidospora sakaeratensis]
MIMQPIDVSWLCGEYGEEHYAFIYLRTTPEEAVARLGGRYANFTDPAPLPHEPDAGRIGATPSASPPWATGRSSATPTGSAPTKN